MGWGQRLTGRVLPVATSSVSGNPNSGSGLSDSNNDDIPCRSHVNPPWRPFYLQRRILLCFLIVFAVILAAIQALSAYSTHNDGIATASPGRHYLGTYGLTSILTLLSVFWSRTEYQSKLIAPWVRPSQSPTSPASRTLLLDYISDFQLLVIFKSAANSDYVVTMTSLISVLLKVLLVVSTGLVTLSWIPVHTQSYPATLLDTFFLNDAFRIGQNDTLPPLILRGVRAWNLSLPDGLSSTYAFQSVSFGNLPKNTITQTRVQGLRNTLSCSPADVTVHGLVEFSPSFSPPESRFYWMNLTARSPHCTASNLLVLTTSAMEEHLSATPTSRSMARFFPVNCDDAANQRPDVILVMMAQVSYASVNISKPGTYNMTSDFAWERSTQMLCTTDYSFTDIEVVRNGTQSLQVTPVEGSIEKKPETVNATDILSAVVNGLYRNEITNLNLPFELPKVPLAMPSILFGTKVDLDSYMRDALMLKFGLKGDQFQVFDGDEAFDLYDFNTLYEAASEYYSLIAAIVVKRQLMVPASIPTTGSIRQFQQRLVVRNWSAQWMAGMMAVCILLILFIIFIAPQGDIMPCNPSTFATVATYLTQLDELMALLRHSGTDGETALHHILGPCKFYGGILCRDEPTKSRSVDVCEVEVDGDLLSEHSPVSAKHRLPDVLGPGARIATVIIPTGMILALELLLLKSNRENGLGGVKSETYLHYTWTTLPSAALEGLAIILSSVDFSTVSIMPYLALQQPVTLATFLDLDFLDMTTPYRILHEIKMRKWSALASTSAVLAASLFTIFSSSLFGASSIPLQASIVLKVGGSFDRSWLPPLDVKSHEVVPSLILTSNLSFPRFTYEELAFPELVVESMQHDNVEFNASAASMDVVVPAIRGKLSCRSYDESMINIGTISNDSYGRQIPTITIKGEECRPPHFNGKRYNFLSYTRANTTLFGLAQATDGTAQGCSLLLYTWGQLYDLGIIPVPRHIAAMGCNASFELVDVETHFVNDKFDLDLDHPPTPLEHTARSSTIPLRRSSEGSEGDNMIYELYEAGLPSGVSTPFSEFGQFFSALTQSPWAIPKTYLMDPAKSGDVEKAIVFHHNLLVAQMFDSYRVPVNAPAAYNFTGSLTDYTHDAHDVLPRYNGTLTQKSSYLRVVQDATSTRILEALLGLALLLFTANWALMPDRRGLPARSPTTIAAAAAIVAGGNLANVLPVGAANMDRAALQEALGPGYKFWMGWGRVPDEDIDGPNENGESRFGVFAVREGDKLEQTEG